MNWLKDKEAKILVCTQSNVAADLITQRLSNVEQLKEEIIRLYSQKTENLHKYNEIKDSSNFCISLLHKTINFPSEDAVNVKRWLEFGIQKLNNQD